ncbi:MAG: hypothetical protein AAF389_19760 [Gemmatimonadota bacterium]
MPLRFHPRFFAAGIITLSVLPSTATGQSLVFPSGLALDSNGDVVVADRQAHFVFRIVLETGAMSVIAGTGDSGFSGDGGPASEAVLSAPEWVEFDDSGNLYLADRGNYRVRVISTDGVIRTIVGDGDYESDGDGGAAISASLTHPFGLHLGPQGDLYIFDTETHRVRRVDGRGTITTVIGNGDQGFSGDGGPATDATFYRPHNGVFAPDGTLIFGDSFNQRIRRWHPTTGLIETLYGRGEQGSPVVGEAADDAAFTYFGGMLLAPDGDLIFTSLDHRIYEIDAYDGTVRHLAGTGEPGFSGDGGPAVDAAINVPYGIVMTPSGDLIFSDASNSRVRVIDAETGVIRTLAGG